MPTYSVPEIHDDIRGAFQDGSTDVARGHVIIITNTGSKTGKSSTSQGEKVNGVCILGSEDDLAPFSYATCGDARVIVKNSTAVAIGDQLTSAGNGTVEPAATGDVICGIALTAASASYTGQEVVMRLAMDNYYPHA